MAMAACCTAMLQPSLTLAGRPVRVAAQASHARRKVFECVPMAAASEAAEAAATPSSSGGVTHQAKFCVGSTVYDNTKKKNRGYGAIIQPAKPTPDGQPRWTVKFDGGQRTTGVQESDLQLVLINRKERVEPSAVQQRFVVVVGSRIGKTGVTDKKSGSSWTCKLDGEKGSVTIDACKLHATETAAAEHSLPTFEAQVRGPTMPGNLNGTMIRNRAPHHRRRKRQRSPPVAGRE